MYVDYILLVFLVKKKTANELRSSDGRSDVCSSDLDVVVAGAFEGAAQDLFGVERVTAEPFLVGAHHARGRVGQAFARWMVAGPADQIGKASCRARVCQAVSISAAAVALKTQQYVSYSIGA